MTIGLVSAAGAALVHAPVDSASSAADMVTATRMSLTTRPFPGARPIGRLDGDPTLPIRRPWVKLTDADRRVGDVSHSYAYIWPLRCAALSLCERWHPRGVGANIFALVKASSWG